MPAIIYSKKKDKVEVICAQGPAPAGATIDHYKGEGLDLIPGDGLLATVIPGSFDGWMLMLRDYGTLSVRDVLEPAIYYAANGHPVLPRVAATINGLERVLSRRNGRHPLKPGCLAAVRPSLIPISGIRCLPKPGSASLPKPKPGKIAKTQIEAARDAFYRGFVAEKIADYLKNAEVMDASGNRHKAVLTADDMANWKATVEEPQTYDYHGWTIAKTGPWGQGPVLLQSLALLKGFDLASMDPNGADFIHTVTEAMKLAYADREVYYGDPAFCDVPMRHLLSDTYNDERRKLISAEASMDLRPGTIAGLRSAI